MSAASDLRHMTSNPTLVSPRHSQHLRAHSPARSPTSIPSSPTSVHSSSSAIFERDIEPLSPPSPQTHTTLHASTNAHRIPRSKTTEQIEHSVPSVLDSAAAILASIENANDVSIITPASYSGSFAGSGFASPIGSLRSRSPSPTIGSLTAHGRNSLLLSIPQQQQQQAQAQQGLAVSPPGAPRSPPPLIQTTTNNAATPAPPAIVTPTSAYFSVADESETGSTVYSADESEAGADPSVNGTHPEVPQSPPPTTSAPLPPLPSPAYSSTSHPASPSSATSIHPSTNAASKRLSFISYADLLTSTPTSTLPLSSLTTAASASEPPPHLPGVTSPSPGTSLRGFAMSPTNTTMTMGGDVFGSPGRAGSTRGKRDSAVLGPGRILPLPSSRVYSGSRYMLILTGLEA
ncbi:hypothetical protein FPV67DRAFT_1670008 [Lyophyllum atratum]|nr:hypothetical protein FPV67DRAFT_1670008 [Lyophyllum atratum]